MKKRILFLLYLFLVLLGLFVLQKPIFIISNAEPLSTVTLSDYFNVMFHGLSLDLATSSYLVIIPLFVVLASIWWKNMNLRKILLPYYILISLVAAAIFIGDNVLYGFWKFKLDASVFIYLASPKDAMASVSIWFVIIRLLLVLLYAFVATYIMWKITPKKLSVVRKRILYTSMSPIVMALLVLMIRGGFGRSTTNIGQVYYSDNQFLNHSAVNPAFNLLASLGKVDDFAEEFNFFPDKQMNAIFDRLYPLKYIESDDSTDMVLNTTRPNILIIIMEGFGQTFVSSIGGMPGVTPNFNKLADEGIIFSQCFGNSFRTDRGVVCALSGYLGLPTTSIMKMPAKSQSLPSIAKSLSQAGYATDFLYGGDVNFTNMQSYLRSTGYKKIRSDIDFSLKERTSNAWGVNDDITFDYLYNDILHRDSSKPWMTTFLTLSSHEPFEVPYNRLKEKVPNSMAYTDDCLGKFVAKLKKTPIWENLLIICVADHGIIYPANAPRPTPKFFRIPLLMAGGALNTHKRYDEIINQTDIAATLLAQLKLPHKDFRFSRNVLNRNYKRYPFATYSYQNGFAFIDSTGISVFDNDGMKTIINEGVDNRGADNRVNSGKAIIQRIYDDLGNR